MKALTLAIVLAVPACAEAQNIFAMDGTGAFSTNVFNFDSFASDSHVTMTRQAGICPSSGDAIRYVLNSDVSHSQPSWGHTKTVSDSPSQGAKRFYRIRIRFNGSTDFAGNSGPWYTKWNIFGANEGRVIVHFGVGGINNTTPNAWISKNVDLSPPTRVPLSITNQWNYLQFRLQSGTTSVSTDGRVDTYYGADNTSESTPTDTESGVRVDLTGADGWTNAAVGTGGFNQTTITSAGFVSMDLCDVQYGTTFDTAWNSPSGGGGGTSPYRFRFKVQQDDGLWLGLVAAGCVVTLRLMERKG